MIAELPLSNDAAQAFTCQLGEVKYYFEARINSRNGVWTLDMYDDATRAPIIQGMALVLGQDLLAPYNFGIGSLVVIDNSAQGKEAGEEDLGARVAVYWVSPDEVLTEGAA